MHTLAKRAKRLYTTFNRYLKSFERRRYKSANKQLTLLQTLPSGFHIFNFQEERNK
jgi:hypothetical protein